MKRDLKIADWPGFFEIEGKMRNLPVSSFFVRGCAILPPTSQYLSNFPDLFHQASESGKLIERYEMPEADVTLDRLEDQIRWYDRIR